MFRKLVIGFSVAIFSIGAAQSDDSFPSRSVRIIDAYSAGGSSDVAMRLLTDAFGRALGQTVLVENKPGAGGLVGTAAFHNSAPDGYTLMIATNAILVVIPAAKSVSYDAENDFIPLGLIWQTPQILAISPNLKVTTLNELVNHAKTAKGITMGSAGHGTTTHLSIEFLKRETGMPITHVPFRGTGNSLQALLSHQIDGIFGDASLLTPHVEAKTVTALAVTGPNRSRLLPEGATAAEAGFPSLRVTTWFGLVAHPKTPPAIVQKLRNALKIAQTDPTYRKNVETKGIVIRDWDPESFAELLKRDRATWTPMIKEAGIKLD
jgi:tripartite-type tricarboxylate transporter receptor subunit TctC